MAWKLAPALTKLISEVNAEWPGRDKSSDGTLGDDSHAARKSEHNPNRDTKDDVPDGYVTAADITANDAGLRDELVAKLIKDPRCWYIINRGIIRSRTHGFAPQKYTGSNPHTHHIHISLVQTKAACNSTAKWLTKTADPKPTESVKPYPTLKRGDSQPILVPFLKRYFALDHINDNPLFGSGTEVAVKRFQRKNKLVQDGIVGPKTWAAIKNGGTMLPPGWKI